MSQAHTCEALHNPPSEQSSSVVQFPPPLCGWEGWEGVVSCAAQEPPAKKYTHCGVPGYWPSTEHSEIEMIARKKASILSVPTPRRRESRA